MVVFDRYAFDLSQFAGGPQAVKYSIRERYLWQLLLPDPNDPFFIEQPGQFRAELHDRLMAPLYPIAFVVIAFAYLGAPRTTRQSRTHVDDRRHRRGGGAAPDRLCLAPCSAPTMPWMLALQYVALASPSSLGLWRDPPRPDHRAAGLHRQLAHRAHRAHHATFRNVSDARPCRSWAEHWRAISACAS